MSVLHAAPRRTVDGPSSRLRRLDWVLLLAAVTLAGLGAVLVYSATRNDAALTGGQPDAFLQRHLVNTAIGLVLGGMVAFTGWHVLRTYAPLLYAGSLLGLVAVLSPLGDTVNGARSWITLPAGFSLQPAELAKIALVVVLAVCLNGPPGPAGSAPTTYAPARHQVTAALALLAAPMALILLQPDLGTVTVFGAIGLAALVVAGVRARWLIALVVAGCAVVLAAIRMGVLRDYQLARFAAFADPALDPLGIGYNTAQARIAIGSGGAWGTGLFNGSQTSGSRIPEQHTDFVFTVAAEELGFAGAALVIALFGVLLWRSIRIGAQAADLAGRVAAAGTTGWFAFQIFQNIGMCLGIMPVTGLPLPFVSYGGSSMFASLLAVGVLQSIRLQGDGPLLRTVR